MSTSEHKKMAPQKVTLGILTISTTRSLRTDKSGAWIEKQGKKEGHEVVCREIVPDNASAISKKLLDVIRELQPHAMVLTGGTGISHQDVTIEAIRPLIKKELTAFGCLFAQLSFDQVDSAAILSRAMAGTVDNTIVFCIPGSLAACKLACNALIFPELGHIVKHIQKG